MTLTNLQRAENDLLRIIGSIEVLEQKLQPAEGTETAPLTREEVTLYLKYALRAETDLEENITKMLNAGPANPSDKVKAHQELLIRNMQIIASLNTQQAAFPRDTASQSSTPPQHDIKLPTLELQPFNGDPTAWTSFRDLFTTAVHNKSSLSNVQKLTYLKSLVTDEAARQIHMFQLTDTNYDLAWKSLVERYDNEREQLFAILKKLTTLTTAQATPASVRVLLDTARGCVEAFNSLKGTPDHLFVYLIFTKMDPSTKELWFQAGNGNKVPALKDVYNFLEQRAIALAAGSSSSTLQRTRQPDKVRVHTHYTSFNQPYIKCTVCSQPHRLFKCQQFLRLSIQERNHHVKSNNLCKNCLSSSGHSPSCNTTACKVCNKKHHTLLHFQSSIQPTQNKDNQANIANQTPTSTHSVSSLHCLQNSSAPPGFLGTALIQIRGPNGKFYCRALLDGCSEASFISTTCAERLGLKTTPTSATINGVMNSSAGKSCESTEFIFTPHFSAHPKIAASAYVVPEVSSNHPRHHINRDELYHTQDIQLADPQFDHQGPIDLLIGSELFWELLESETRKGLSSQPIATKTTLGWVIAGRRKSFNTVQISSFITNLELNNKLEMFWKADTSPKQNEVTTEEKQCKADSTSTITRTVEGRFITSIPWKQQQPPLGESKAIAVRRLKSMEQRLDSEQSKHSKHEYIKYLSEYENMLHINEVTPYPVYYIPPQFVLKPDSTTTKLRVVLDASSKRTSGYSLNDCMMVGPTIQSTLPRLEFDATNLLAEPTTTAVAPLFHSISKIQAYYDSTITLPWIKSDPNRWRTCVRNRVIKIQENIPPQYWYHIPGENNPADCAYRGLSPSDLIIHNLGWHGYPVADSQDEFNVQLDTKQIKAETKKTTAYCAHLTLSSTDNFIHRYSPLTRPVRAPAITFRFTLYLRGRRRIGPVLGGELTLEEIKYATNGNIRYTQLLEFRNKIKWLHTNKPLPPTNKLLSLSPVLFNDLLCVGGRLRKSRLNQEANHPVLLPRSHHITDLIIQHSHTSNLHSGCQATLAHLNQKYWIVRGRDAVRYLIKKCLTCVRQRGQTMSQLMGDLPDARVNPSRPFTHCGVDYAGPFTIKNQGRSKVNYKCWLVLFVCFATRALHLELATSLSTDGFLAAFRRFVSRRGRPHNMYSDCGTNFIGAQRILHHISSNKAIASYCATEGIRWNFNPPGAPHMGGLWEAGVKSVKHHLARVMGSHTLTYEELLTLITQIEGILNSRPLTTISTDPDDLQALTPGHFLIGAPLNSVPDENLLEIRTNRLTRWQLIQQQQQSFWSRWQKEFITRMQQRPKWMNMRNQIQLGDIVIIKDDNAPPTKWKLGKVIKTHSGDDNITRVVTLKTQQGELKRSITKLCLLPVSNPSNDEELLLQ